MILRSTVILAVSLSSVLVSASLVAWAWWWRARRRPVLPTVRAAPTAAITPLAMDEASRTVQVVLMARS